MKQQLQDARTKMEDAAKVPEVLPRASAVNPKP